MKMEMMLPNYTSWSGMSCGGKKGHDESWSETREEFWIHGKINGEFLISSSESLLIFFIRDMAISR